MRAKDWDLALPKEKPQFQYQNLLALWQRDQTLCQSLPGVTTTHHGHLVSLLLATAEMAKAVCTNTGSKARVSSRFTQYKTSPARTTVVRQHPKDVADLLILGMEDY